MLHDFLSLLPDGWQALLTLAVILLLFGLSVFTSLPADFIFGGGLALLLIAGVIGTNDALAGFSSPGMVTVGLLYVVVAGLQETGGLSWISTHILGNARGSREARLKLMLPVSLLSAFLNNTPVVAMFIPVVRQWSKKINVSPSQLMIPLSYATILGGMCTLIGTSTNLVVNGMLQERYGGAGIGMFEITAVGVPILACGLLYLFFFGDKVLPQRSEARRSFEEVRSYTAEMVVNRHLHNTSVEGAGLRHLSGGYLVEIIREGRVISPVSPETLLHEHDRLVFAGIVESILELRGNRGLSVPPDHQFDLTGKGVERNLVEVVVSATCPLIGTTIRDGNFRKRYNAAIIAATRNGERIEGRIGDITLHPGDTLLLETHAGFIPRQKDSRDFYLVGGVEETAPSRLDRSGIAASILGALVITVAFGWVDILKGSIIASLAMIVTGCCTVGQARKAIEWNVLIVIGAALGIGIALEKSGAAKWIAELLLAPAGNDPYLTLALVYLATALLTEVITNNAAAALLFPIAVNAAETLGVSHMPYVIAVMIAASASFSTPIGYQTNLMVFGPGGYRFTDYFKAGIPLNLMVGAVTLLLAPLLWPF